MAPTFTPSRRRLVSVQGAVSQKSQNWFYELQTVDFVDDTHMKDVVSYVLLLLL